MSLEKSAGIIGIKASRLGIDRHGFQGRPAKRRQREREAFGRTHRRFVNAKAPPGRFGIVILHPPPFLFAPIHRPNIKCRIFIEARDSFPRQPHPLVGCDHRLKEKLSCRIIDPRTMELQIGSHTLKVAGAIEHDGTKPCSMSPRTHDAHVALMPMSFEIGPGLGPARPKRHLAPPAFSDRTFTRFRPSMTRAGYIRSATSRGACSRKWL